MVSVENELVFLIDWFWLLHEDDGYLLEWKATLPDSNCLQVGWLVIATPIVRGAQS